MASILTDPANLTIVVPVGLRYLDANGDPVTALFPLEYLILVGQDLAVLSGTTNQLAAGIALHSSQIAALQAAVATIPPTYTTPTISGQCLNSSVVLPIDQILTLQVTAWCNFLTVTGSQSALATSITTQCVGLNAGPSFATPGTSMSAITGWRATPTTIADTIANLWYTSCDLRGGMTRVLDAITPNCSQVIVNYQATINYLLSFNFYFDGYTFVPPGYVDTGSKIKIVDDFDNVYLTGFNIVTQSTTNIPFTINASGSTLSSTSTRYTAYVTSNLSNPTLGTTCSQTVVVPVIGTPTPFFTNCCPDIGNFTALISSGTTSIVAVSSLSYMPRFAEIAPKDAFTAGQLFAGGVSPYFTYTGSGFILHPGAPTGVTGTFNFDWKTNR